ncbi:hypothetical protein [Streptomyces sp. CRN 30]|uniref:hypothetical protein n=1 Tax=Streptomyces sp. CRN 30 TaxID=3075613 RepID=UPI002A81420B|nr:hypothetical protein [Streptomyces sp. CRN 30]
MAWLPHDFVHPLSVAIPGGAGHRLRPISGADAPLDHPAVRGSRERLWVVDDEVGGALERALDVFVPRWIAEDWPFERPRFVGRDLTWDEWLALPDIG